jgi:hypothetical protein
MSQGHWSGSCCSESQRVVPASLIQRQGPVCVEQFAPKWKDYWMSLDDIEQLLANYWLLLDAFACYSRWLSGIGCYWMLLHIIGCLCSVLPEPPHLYVLVSGFQLPRFMRSCQVQINVCHPGDGWHSWRASGRKRSCWLVVTAEHVTLSTCRLRSDRAFGIRSNFLSTLVCGISSMYRA